MVDELIAQFRIHWSTLDPRATGVIKGNCFETLLFKLGEPLGLSDRHRFDK